MSRSTSLLHATAGPGAGRTVWLLVMGLWAIKFGIDPIQQLAELPVGAAEPTGVLRHVPRAVSDRLLKWDALVALRVAGAAAFAAALYRPGSRLAAAPALLGCVLATLTQSILRGYGHVNHAEIPLLLIAWLLATWKALGRQPLDGRVATAAALVFLLTYHFAGAYRLAHSGLSIFAGDSMTVWSVFHAARVWHFEFDLGYEVASRSWLAAALWLGFPVITLAELLAPLALVSRYFRWAFIMVVGGFHVGSLLLFEIVFWENTVLLLVLLGRDWGARQRGGVAPEHKSSLEYTATVGEDLPGRGRITLCERLHRSGHLSPWQAAWVLQAGAFLERCDRRHATPSLAAPEYILLATPRR